MAVNSELYIKIAKDLKEKKVTLVAVSKTKPIEDILELYHLGQRDFGENYVQELLEKYQQLPKDIRWHFIGHLQSNKVKLIAPFVSLIHSVDSEKLLKEIDKQAKKNNRVIDCLLQVYIAKEETKFGLDAVELHSIITRIFDTDCTNSVKEKSFRNVCIKGFMGMASFTNDQEIVRKEFKFLKCLFDKYSTFDILSMGMSADYKMAIEEGSNMVRIGSLLFGKRNYSTH
jgi:pyridoxal phosphate enzyme (YggS family)